SKPLGHGRWLGGAGAVTADLFRTLGFFNRVPDWFTAQVLDAWQTVTAADTSNMTSNRSASVRAGFPFEQVCTSTRLGRRAAIHSAGVTPSAAAASWSLW
ncbi:MAG TPA: hypothetical protein VGX50_01435, partial [Longimicrobium sp.]|nr:hypothetical protein [Longimicrobium sp.]